MPNLTKAQEAALRSICERYSVVFDPAHYLVYDADSWMMPGWAEGWVGGHGGHGGPGPHRTVFVGVSPEGSVHS